MLLCVWYIVYVYYTYVRDGVIVHIYAVCMVYSILCVGDGIVCIYIPLRLLSSPGRCLKPNPADKIRCTGLSFTRE